MSGPNTASTLAPSVNFESSMVAFNAGSTLNRLGIFGHGRNLWTPRAGRFFTQPPGGGLESWSGRESESTCETTSAWGPLSTLLPLIRSELPTNHNEFSLAPPPTRPAVETLGGSGMQICATEAPEISSTSAPHRRPLYHFRIVVHYQMRAPRYLEKIQAERTVLPFYV